MFYEHLKRIRIHSEVTQQELAEYLNVSTQSISKWENGQSMPSIEYLPKMAEFFNCCVETFFSDYELEFYEKCGFMSDKEVVDFLIKSYKPNVKRRVVGDAVYITEKYSLDSVFLPPLYYYLCAHETFSIRTLQESLDVGYVRACEIAVALKNIGILDASEKVIIKDKIDLLLPFFERY